MFKDDYNKFMDGQSPRQESLDAVKKEMEHHDSTQVDAQVKGGRILHLPIWRRTVAAAACLALLVATIPFVISSQNNGSQPNPNLPQGQHNELAAAANFEEIYSLISNISTEAVYGLPRSATEEMVMAEDMDTAAPALRENPATGTTGNRSSYSETPDFSDTNLQMLGVQEADIVKTDGRHIYAVSDNFINIISAVDGRLELFWQIERQDNVGVIQNRRRQTENPRDRGRDTSEIYITDGRLILLSRTWDVDHNELARAGSSRIADWGRGGWWGWGPNQAVIAEIYDVSDMNQRPVKLGEVGQSGSYISSRMIGETLYLATNHTSWEDPDLARPETFIPQIIENGERRVIAPEDIILNDNLDRVQHTVISGIDTSGSGNVISTQSLLGFGWNIYASHNNIFITNTEHVGENSEHGESTRARWSHSHTMTNITRISLDNGIVRAEASATIAGNILNQFSMDEYNGTFRIVTTFHQWWSNTERYYGPTDRFSRSDWDGSFWHWEDETEIEEGVFQWVYYFSDWENRDRVYRETWTETSTNNLYVLDMDLNIIGAVEGLAPGERVFSVRFMGDICFFVTFRDVDPLFAADLSDPTNPVILSELKIPGFSDYLHPFGDGRLFGFGRDAAEETGMWGYLKLSMFNTDNLLDVYERHTLSLDGFWWSESSYNHKAILIDVDRNIIAFPSENAYLVYGYDDVYGFFQRGIIEFDNEYDEWGWQRWWGQMRGLYIGDYLYVLTGSHIASFSLTSFESVDFLRFD